MKMRPIVTLGVLNDQNEMVSAAADVSVASVGDDHEAAIKLSRPLAVFLGVRVGVFVDAVLVRTFLVRSGPQSLGSGHEVRVHWRGTL